MHMKRSRLSFTENSSASDLHTAVMKDALFGANLPRLVNSADEVERSEALQNLRDLCDMSYKDIMLALKNNSGRVNFEKPKVKNACAYVERSMPLVQAELF